MRNRTGRKRVAGVAVCMALVMGLSGCAEEVPQEAREEVSVAVSAGTPQVGDLSVSGTYIGTVSPEEQVNIIPLVSGEVTEVNFEVGDYVEAGSVLVRIDDEAARLQLESARLSREGAELSANRTLGSAQVMNNLTMESNINSIQYQIDMAKRQYEAAGDSVSDAYEAKDDMQKALDKINGSISDMEDGYNDMRRMAVAAKNLVEQDDAGVWRWIDPSPLHDGMTWEDIFYTSQEEEDEAKKNTGSGPDPDASGSSNKGAGSGASSSPASGQQPASPSGSLPPVKGPDLINGSAGIGQNGSSSGTQGEKTDQTEDGDGEQESVAPEESGASGSSQETDQNTDRGDEKTGNGGAETEKETQSPQGADGSGKGVMQGNDVQESDAGQEEADLGRDASGRYPGRQNRDSLRTAESGIYELSLGGAEEGNMPGMEEIRRHVRPWESREARPLRSDAEGTGRTEENAGYRIMAVTNNTTGGGGQGDPSVPKEKRPYAEYLRARELCDSTAQAIEKLKAAGYSAADIGEGRMDSSVANYATQIASLRSQAATLESNIKSMDGNITSAETSRSTTADSIDFYEDNLKNAQIQYGIQNGQAYQDTAAALANQIASADVGIASAQMQLENYVLTAPVSGYIEQKNVDDYGMVSAGNPVYVISNKDSMTVTFYVSEAVRNQMVVGRPVTLERGGQSLTAAVTRVGQSVDARTGLFEIRATVENSDLASGVTVKVHAETAGTRDALLIPYDAVYYEGKQAYVYCVEEDILHKIPVETGIYNEDTIEITGGLTKDSVVVNTWSARLAEGIRVHLVDQ